MRRYVVSLLGWMAFLQIGIVHAQLWPEIHREMKPWARWWWMGSGVDTANLGHLLSAYQEKGFGGVEIAPIYGAVGYEDRYLRYLSPEWMHALRYTVEQAGKLDMGVDLTNGTGWPFGGPQIGTTYGASKLLVRKELVQDGQGLPNPLLAPDEKQPQAPLLSVTAYGPKGEVLLLSDQDGANSWRTWRAKGGSWEIYATFLGKTKQRVKRAAPGGEGFTMDHFSKEALQAYLAPFDEAFGTQTPGFRAVYNDSYEVYDANWTDVFFDTFKKNRGYDLRYHIREWMSDDATDEVARIKSDYRETMSELLLENFTKTWTDWAHRHQRITRNQAHGSPGNLLDLYAAVDIPEVETFGATPFPIPGLKREEGSVGQDIPDPMMLKFASSAAHVSGKKWTSCETFTWLTDHFKTSWSQCKPEVDQVFLAGINHVFYHGVTYSPQEAPWPGWLFYAAVNFVPTNSLWGHLDGLNQYIARTQSILQRGEPDNELLLYWPIYDAWNDPKGKDMPMKVHNIDQWLHPSAFYQQANALQQAGYSFDFVSDGLLKSLSIEGGSWNHQGHALPYKTLVIPRCERMPLETLETLIRLIEQGATVIFQSLPADVPGNGQLEERRKKEQILLNRIKALAANQRPGQGKVWIQENVLTSLKAQEIVGETLQNSGLKFIRRKVGNDLYYYLVNLTDHPIDEALAVRANAPHYYLMDASTGLTGKAEVLDKGVRVQLAPGESRILLAAQEEKAQQAAWPYLGSPTQTQSLSGPWELSFQEGGPTLPAPQKLEQVVPWTALKDTAYAHFSGKAVYKTTFVLSAVPSHQYLLKLDSLYESAKIRINGRDAGLIWSLPYQLSVGSYLKEGENTIEIEVANLMANRIRYMDQHQMNWKAYHDTKLVDIHYKPFDASSWKVSPSGLGGKVYLVQYK